HAGAQDSLGAKFYEGNGVIQDELRAYMWFEIAAKQGDKIGAKNRDFLAKTMTAALLLDAKELARECIRKNYKGC
ncbi:hypothetical protein OAN80_05895, partial [Alphaproteobacteria bacterium]|nr:hypothetical protein [Alphaproteobacteria bacterium]